LGKGTENEAGTRTSQPDDQLGELEHRELNWVADVHGTCEALLSFHHRHQGVHEVVDVAEGSGLRAIAIDGDVFSFQGLHDEIAHYAAIVRVHARAVGVEDPHDLDVHFDLPPV